MRKGGWEYPSLDFPKLKRAFISIFTELREAGRFDGLLGFMQLAEDEAYFKPGLCGNDEEMFFFRKLGRVLWPFHTKIQNEVDLFSVIELLYDYVDREEYFESGIIIENQKKYRADINKLLKNYGEGYQLSALGEVQTLAPSGLEPLTEETLATGDLENIDKKIARAISLFRRYNATSEDKKEAIRTLGDILEYLADKGHKLPKKDDRALFNILNNFGFRHHNRSQQKDYDKPIFYEWTFYVILSSIHALLKLGSKT